MGISVSAIFKIINSLANREDQEKLEGLYGAYTSSQEKIFDLREEVAKLRFDIIDKEQTIRELNIKLDKKEQLVRMNGAYFYREPNNELSGPICPHYYHEEGFVNYLTNGTQGAHCSICKCSYPGVETEIKGPKRRVL